eukprot:1146964-Lingulodinium_polyedra.AAC.1
MSKHRELQLRRKVEGGKTGLPVAGGVDSPDGERTTLNQLKLANNPPGGRDEDNNSTLWPAVESGSRKR